MQPIDIAHAALMEAGRPDLANRIVGNVEKIGGFYIDIMTDSEDEEIDWALIDKAEMLARASIGLPPIDRSMWSAGGPL